MTRRKIARRRAAVAYDVLRGRPVRAGYGLLVVVPLLAAAGGALIGWGLETLASRNRTAQPATAVDTAANLRPESVSV
jgi:hypothetical protein